jgi:AraC-like DNA-binding protein
MNEIISFLSSGSLLLLFFLAFTNPNKVNNIANKWFSIFLLSVFLVNLDSFFYFLDKNIPNNLFVNILGLPAYFLAPIFYLSISYFIKPNRIWRAKDNLHFLFGIVFSIFIIGILIFADDPNNLLKNDPKFIKTFTVLIYSFLLLFPLQLIIYGFFTYKKLKKHQKNIKLFSSNTENIDLKWLENIVLIINILLAIWVFDMLLSLSSEKFSIINFFLLIGIFFIAYHFIKQKEIYPFSVSEQNEIIEIIEESDSIENKKKLVDDEQLQLYKTELFGVMNAKKPFLDPEISLVKLALEMDCTPHLLSYIINNGFDENFYQFINRFRIEEAKKLILDPNKNHLSILGIGFEVGFNSKSVFNTTFKKTTQQTPSEFKKN